MTALPRTPAASAAARPSCEQPVVQRGVDLLVDGQRVGDDQRRTVGAEVGPSAHDRGDLLRRLHRGVDREAAVGQVEAREPVGAHADHGDAQRLEPLERGADVEDRLHARRTRR